MNFNNYLNNLTNSALEALFAKLSNTEEYTLIDIVYNELEKRGLVEDMFADEV